MSDALGSLIKDGKNYVLKQDEEGFYMDLLVSTDTYDSKGRLIVEKMKTGLNSNKAVGGLFTPIKADMTEQGRLITVGIKGIQNLVTIEDIDANVEVMGAGNDFIEDFTGTSQEQEKLEVSNIPISDITSVVKNPDTTPVVLTRVYNTAPTTGEYYVDLRLGRITIGGNSGTDVYRITYSIDAGRIKKLIKEITESGLVVTTNETTLSHPIGRILQVIGTGTSGGNKTPIYTGTPSAGEVHVDRDTGVLTFAGADAITSAEVIYETGYKSLGKTLEKKEAGEPVAVNFEGGAH